MILITGASAGIGEATAKAFARERRPLILWARRKEKLEKIVEDCTRLGAPSVSIALIDVRDFKSIEKEVSSKPELYSKVEILVNNAGLAKGLAPIQSDELSHWDEMIDTNLKGLLHTTRALLPHFLKKNSGHIVNLGSAAARWVYPKGHVYCATKAAVHALTEGLRLDLNGTGIRVTEVSPGMVETDFSLVRLGDESKAKSIYQGMTPLTAADIADTILWSCTRPAHMNIQEIVIYPTAQASTTLVSRKP